jgi:hypothetical protein
MEARCVCRGCDNHWGQPCRREGFVILERVVCGECAVTQMTLAAAGEPAEAREMQITLPW